jgi:hypothetical protein
MMVSSMSVWCEIVRDGLSAQSKRDKAEVTRLLASGVGGEEAIRRVYFPWKTPAEYRALVSEYNATYAKT